MKRFKNMARPVIHELITKLEDAIAKFIDISQKIYKEYNLQFSIDKNYIQQMIMSMIAPMDIKVDHDFNSESFLVRKAPKNYFKLEEYVEKDWRYNVTALTMEQELQLRDWALNEHEEGRQINQALLKVKARQICQKESFQATHGWIWKFMIRHPKVKDLIGMFCNKKIKQVEPNKDHHHRCTDCRDKQMGFCEHER